MLRVPCIAFLLALAGAALAQSAGDPAPLSLTLPEAIEQALRGNPSLVDARLDRILERNDAEEAERRFRPQWRLRTSVGYGYGQAEATRTATALAGPGVEMELPTGGRLARDTVRASGSIPVTSSWKNRAPANLASGTRSMCA